MAMLARNRLRTEVPTIEKRSIFLAYVSGNIPTKYGLQNGTFTYLHLLDPEIPIEVLFELI